MPPLPNVSATTAFFVQKNAAAVLKHLILREYLPTYVSIVGKAAPEHLVSFFDGYAGAGQYDDGEPGSPTLAAETAKRLAEFRELRCYYVEKDRKTFLRLSEQLTKVGHEATLFLGDVEDHLDTVLAQTFGSPLFAFLDPFGLLLSMDSLIKLLARADRLGVYKRGPTTEVLLTFSLAGIYRNIGHLTSDANGAAYGNQRASKIHRVNIVLGGTWWQGTCRAHVSKGERDRLILDGYLNEIARRAPGWRTGLVPIPSSVNGAIVYYLIFLTRSPHGIWHFNDAVSLAREKMLSLWLKGQMPILDLDEFYSSVIAKNLSNLMQRRPEFRVLDFAEDVFGEVLGSARGKHVHSALKQLYSAGMIDSDGRGRKVKEIIVRRTKR